MWFLLFGTLILFSRILAKLPCLTHLNLPNSFQYPQGRRHRLDFLRSIIQIAWSLTFENPSLPSTLKWMRKRTCTSQKPEIHVVTETLGVKVERQQMKGTRCKEDVRPWRRREDRTEMDEGARRDVHFYLSSHYVSISIYITLSIFIWTRARTPTHFFAHWSWWNWGKEWAEKSETARLHCCDPLL